MTALWIVSLVLAQATPYPWPHAATEPLAQSFPAPAGVHRTNEAADTFAAWLRQLPLLPQGTPVRLFDGSLKRNQRAHARVIDIDVGSKDHQQCADAVIRLRAEYLFSQARHDELCFHATNGASLSWSRWRKGWRPRLSGKTIAWAKSAAPNASWSSFRRYLDFVFVYAGTYSLERELQPVLPDEPIRIGDVFIQGGFPGHAVIVVDVAENEHGERMFLLAQGYMPAQSAHVLVRPSSTHAWYPFPVGQSLETPEWTFSPVHRVRFRDGQHCPD